MTGLRSIGSIVQAVVANAAKDRDALIKAHEHAEAFHAAMSRAIYNARELEDTKALAKGSRTDWSDLIAEYEKAYQEALGEAAAALEQMPIRWAAVLHAGITAPVQVAAE